MMFVDFFHHCFWCSLEYCGSRAVPSVVESQYLSHLGDHLHLNIDILWTGEYVFNSARILRVTLYFWF